MIRIKLAWIAAISFAALWEVGLYGQQISDPANLTGEQIKASSEVRDIAVNRGSTALWQSLLKLRTRASLMMIVAHPDDEDGGMLAYESRGQGTHVAMLTLTRGEGGQNLMSGDFDGALGLVRTQELLAAGRYMGIDQMWGTQIDFGFSKTKEESFANWGHDHVLYDAVRAVRLYRPLVITAVFQGGITDGHGQHQVSGEMAQEVYSAAGDPTVFPDQIAAGLEPWKPLKVYARVPFYSISNKGMFDYATGKYAPARFYNYITKQWTTEAPQANVVVPEGTYSPVLGMSYLQFARLGLGLQKTQNGGMGIPGAGAFDMPYHRYASRVDAGDHEAGFFDGIDTSLPSIASLAGDSVSQRSLRASLIKVDGIVKQAFAAYSIDHPEKTAPYLRDGLKATEELIDGVEKGDLDAKTKYDVLHELKLKRVEFNDALVQALGLSINAQVSPAESPTGPFTAFSDTADTFLSAIPGQTFGVQVRVANGSGVPVSVQQAELKSTVDANIATARSNTEEHPKLGDGDLYDAHFNVTLSKDAEATKPPFERGSDEQAFYDVAEPALRNASLALPPLTAWATVNYQGVSIRVGQIVQTARRVTGQGVVYEPLVITPAISVQISPSAGIVPLGEKSFRLTAHIQSNVKGTANGSVRLKLPAGWTSEPKRNDFTLAKDGDSLDVPFTVHPGGLEDKSYSMTAVATFDGREYRVGYKTVGYAGLPATNLYRPATYTAHGVDVKIAPGLRVGYLPGTGDEVEASLENLGVHATTLSMKDICTDTLSHFDVIVLGVRAYSAHPDLAAVNGQLLEYARHGGVVIVQYNSRQFDRELGPAPLTLGGDGERVVDEQDPVAIVEPTSAVLRWPNVITTHDFDHWIEERGHGFMESWDAKYEAPLETHDPEQAPQRGGLLIAHTGKGIYVYVSFALYRQLPEGVPGAYRLFANLLSLGKQPRSN